MRCMVGHSYCKNKHETISLGRKAVKRKNKREYKGGNRRTEEGCHSGQSSIQRRVATASGFKCIVLLPHQVGLCHCDVVEDLPVEASTPPKLHSRCKFLTEKVFAELGTTCNLWINLAAPTGKFHNSEVKSSAPTVKFPESWVTPMAKKLYSDGKHTSRSMVLFLFRLTA